MSAAGAPHPSDPLPLWEIARRWAGGDETRAKDLYARIWAAYWKGDLSAEGVVFWLRATPEQGTFLSMPPTGPGGLFGLADGDETLGRIAAGDAERVPTGLQDLARWTKDDYDRIRSRLLRSYIDGAHLTREGFIAWCGLSGEEGERFWPASEQRDLVEACRQWLSTRKSLRGDESKKILRQAAAAVLPGLTELHFRQAFRDVYGRKTPQATPPLEPSSQ
jgi:hypothetical protein